MLVNRTRIWSPPTERCTLMRYVWLFRPVCDEPEGSAAVTAAAQLATQSLESPIIWRDAELVLETTIKPATVRDTISASRLLGSFMQKTPEHGEEGAPCARVCPKCECAAYALAICDQEKVLQQNQNHSRRSSRAKLFGVPPLGAEQQRHQLRSNRAGHESGSPVRRELRHPVERPTVDQRNVDPLARTSCDLEAQAVVVLMFEDAARDRTANRRGDPIADFPL